MLDMFKKLLGGNLEDLAKTVSELAEQPKSPETPAAPQQKSTPEPKMSAKGDPAVFELQKKLIARGAKITADGINGPATKQAQKDFPDPVEVKVSAPVVGGVITVDLLQKLFPKNKNCSELSSALNAVLPKYQINTPERIAGFLAQCGHESAGFTVLAENLNYSADGLCKVFPKRFPSAAAAQPYHRQPEKIANKIYCDRMGNGSEASGDGYKYRGRGAIQLTGKDNYTKFSKSIGKSLDETVAYCETLEGAICSAAWFWDTNKLNSCADINDIVAMTKKINGGTIGLEDRKKHYQEALHILKG